MNSDFFVIRFEDKTYLRGQFESYDNAKAWATKYLESYPRPTKVSIFHHVAELSSKLTIVNTTDIRDNPALQHRLETV
jgi:hypothetical protein